MKLRMMPGETPYTEKELFKLFGLVHTVARMEVSEQDEVEGRIDRNGVYQLSTYQLDELAEEAGRHHAAHVGWLAGAAFAGLEHAEKLREDGYLIAARGYTLTARGRLAAYHQEKRREVLS